MTEDNKASDPKTGRTEVNEPRRDVLKSIGATVSVAALGLPYASVRGVTPAQPLSAAPDPKKYPRWFQWTIIDKKGTREFPAWYPGEPEIWAYTENMSYAEGDTVDLRVHTNCKTFAVRIEKEGYVPDVVLQRTDIPGTKQTTPDDAAIRGCNWKPSFSVKTAGWKPGVYIVFLSCRDESGKTAAGEHFFVVQSRQPGSTASMCLVLSTSTYTAYNDWGGANHYRSIRDGISTDKLEPRLSTQRPWGRGFVVRPPEAPDVIDPTTPPPFWKPDYPEVLWPLANRYSRHYVEGYATYAAKLIRWLEKSGFKFEVATQHDLHQQPEFFKTYKSLLFVGHDEYWSWEMRDTVDNFVNNGGRVGRFGGNIWCQIRLEDGGKTHVCYKDPKTDPLVTTDRKARAAIGWDDPIVNRPAAQTFGLHATGYSRYGATTPRSPGGFTVYRPWHWAFEKTDLYYGDTFGNAPINVFGFEVDGVDYKIENGLPYATGSDHPPQKLVILAMGLAVGGEPDRWGGKVLLNAPNNYRELMKGDEPATSDDHDKEPSPVEPGAETVGRMCAGMMSYFERGKGWVFCAGSSTWVRGLEMDDYYTQQITKNVIARFG